MNKRLTTSGVLLKFAGKVTSVDVRECGYEIMLKSDTMVELMLIDYDTKKNIKMQFTENSCILVEDKKHKDLTKEWLSYFGKYLAKDEVESVNL